MRRLHRSVAPAVRAARVLAALVAAGLGAIVAGCPSETEPPLQTTGVVVGVTSDLTTLSSVAIRMFPDGAEASVQTATPDFPMEMSFPPLEGGQLARVEIEGLDAAGRPVVTRTASTTAVDGVELLLPVSLDSACLYGVDGPPCVAPLTCVKGACVDEFIQPESLSPYSPGWATGGSTDVCKPGGGEPIVVVGEGQGDYLPLDDGTVVQVEAGPQGGYHVWIAVRMKHLLRSGSITSLSGVVPELGYEVPEFNVIFTFDQDEGGYCKLYGLRYRLDSELATIEQLLGKTLDVTVRITDKDGAVGVGTKSLTLSPDFI